MAETIGLSAVMDMAGFEKGMQKYNAGLAGMDKNTGKAASGMSKVMQGMGNAISTALGVVTGQAVIGAVKSVVGGIADMVKAAKDIPNIAASFEGLGGSIVKMREGSLGMVTDVELMKSFNQAAQLVSTDFAQKLPDAMGYLGKVAAATGQDMGFMLDSLVKGVGRVSPMILDNLGIQVNLTEANEAYAASIGKDVAELTKQEQQTAIMNMTMQKLAENTAAMPEVAGTAAQSMAALQTTLQNTKDQIGTAFIPVLQALLVPLANLAEKLGPKVIAWAQDTAKWLTDTIAKFSEFFDVFKGIGTAEEGFSGLVEGLGKVLNLSPKFVDGLGKVSTAFGSLVADVKGRGEELWQEFDRLGKAVSEFVRNIGSGFDGGDTEAGVRDFLASMGIPLDLAQRIGEIFASVEAAIAEARSRIDSAIRDWRQVSESGAMSPVSAALQMLGLPVGVAEQIGSVVTQIQTAVQQGWETIKFAADFARQSIAAGLDPTRRVLEMLGLPPEIVTSITSVVQTLLRSITGAWDQIKQGNLLAAGQMILGLKNQLYNGMFEIAQSALDALSRAFPQLAPLIDGYLRPVLTTVQGLFQQVTGFIAEFSRTVVSTLAQSGPVLEGIGKTVVTLFTAVGSVIEAALPHFSKLAETLIPALVKAFVDLQPVIQKVIEVVQRIINDVLPFAIDLLTDIVAFVSSQIPGIADIFVTALEIIEKVWTAVWPFLAGVLEGAWEVIKRIVVTGVELVQNVLDGLMQMLEGDIVGGLKTIFVDGVGGALSQLWDTLMALPDIFAETLGAAWIQLEEWEADIKDFFRSIPEKIVSWFEEKAENVVKGFEDVAGRIIDGLLKGFQDGWGAVTSWINEKLASLPQVVKDIFGIASPSKVFIGIGKDMLSGLASGMGTGGEEVIQKAYELTGRIEKVFRNMAGAIGAVGQVEQNEDFSQQLTLIEDYIRQMILMLDRLATTMDKDGLFFAKKFNQFMRRIVVLVKDAVDVVIALDEWVPKSTNLQWKIEAMISSFVQIARGFYDARQIMSRGMAKDAAEIADALEGSVSVVQPGLEAIDALFAWEEKTDLSQKALSFAIDLGEIVAVIANLSYTFLRDAVKDAARFAESVTTIVAFIKPSIDSMVEVSEYERKEDPAAGMLLLVDDLEQALPYALTLANKFVDQGLELAAKVLDSVTSVVGFIKPAIEALVSLAEWERTQDVADKASWLVEDTWALVTSLVEASVNVDGEGLEAAQAIYAGTQNMIGFVKPSIDALTALATYQHENRNYGALGESIASAVIALAQGIMNAVNDMDTLLIPAADGFWKAVQDTVAIIKPAVEALAALPGDWDFIQTSSPRADSWAIGIMVLNMVKGLEKARRMVGIDLAEEAGKFWSAVQGVIGIIKPAVDALSALPSDWGFLQNVSPYWTSWALGILIINVAKGLEAARKMVGIDIAEEATVFWGAVQSVIGIIKPAIDAFAALGAYTGTAGLVDKIAVFEADIAELVLMFDRIATSYAAQITEDTATFAGHMTTTLNTVKPAVDALVALAAYASSASLPDKAESLRLDIAAVTDELLILTSDYALAMPSIDQLGVLVGSIGTAVKSAVDTVLTVLEHRQSEIAPAIATMRSSFQAILDGLVDTKDLANDAVPIAQEIETAAKDIASAVQTAFDLFADIGKQGNDVSIWDSLLNMLSNPPKNLYYQAWNLGYGMALNIKAGLEDGLEIASPSKVLERIGMRMKEGLMIGWERPQQLPMQAMTHISNSSQTVSINMGGQTISSDMDAAVLAQTIKRVVIDAIRTAT